MGTRKTPTLDEIRAQYGTIEKIHVKRKQKMSTLDKVAVWITAHVGSMGFFLIIFGWTVIWLGWNTLAPANLRFDTYPGFVLWLFISNMIQIFLMPLIMVGQNLQGAYAEGRAQADFEINRKAEVEIENIMLHLERQDALLTAILKKLDAQGKA